MKFTYDAYRELLKLLQASGYTFQNYHSWEDSSCCVILRHDVDTSLEKAVEMAEMEAQWGIKTTYFVLLRTDFYNVASKSGQRAVQRIHELGHDIGLHFDEAFYDSSSNSASCLIQWEARLLSEICGFPIRAVAMHRPSRATLEADYQIPGIVNSYGKLFFRDFKYLSDSRKHWREPVEDIIRSKEYARLQILTHPFWYGREERTMEETIYTFVNHANLERYRNMEDNLTDLNSVMQESEVR